MYFKKLEIFGFKSFAEKTVLNFEPGITAVVGPNGCGKSNIFDSIRWVLGEQSMKELRGSSREDIIFNGTDKRAPLGMAEVSLTFDNKSKMLPTDDEEVIITRRQYRSGESEYLLNKTIVRLKDITQLLMGTGIGAEAYSMIQQGKVDLVVSSKPEDRRFILDEASGITRYKAKKKEALSKLEDAENNLLRINDIITEIRRQIGSIERQADKARKYKVEFEKLKKLELRVAKYHLDGFSQKKDSLVSEMDGLKEKETLLDQQIELLSQALTDQINLVGELDQKINEIKSEEIKIDGQINVNNGQIAFNEERVDNIRRNDIRLKEQKQQLIDRCRGHQQRIEELKESLISVEKSIVSNEENLIKRREALAVIEETIDHAKKCIRESEEKTFGLTAEQVNLRNDLTDIMKEMQGALARKRRLEMENEKVESEKHQVDEKLRTMEDKLSSTRVVLGELELEKQNKDQQIEELQSQLESLKQSIDTLEKKKLFLISQKDFIEKMHVQYQDMPDPVVEGRFITQVPPLGHHTGIIGKVKNVRLLNPERLESLKANLSVDDPQYIQVQQLYEIICETKFIELDPQQISQKIDEINQEIGQLEFQKNNLLERIKEEQKIQVRLEEECQSKEKEYSILEAQRKDILEEISKLINELELVSSEFVEVREHLMEAKKKEEAANALLDSINQEIAFCQGAVKESQFHIEEQLKARQETTIAIAQLEAEIQSDKDKLKSQKANLVMFIDSLDNDLGEIKKIDDEIVAQQAKEEDYQREIENIKQRIEELNRNRQSLEAVLRDYEIQKGYVGQKINTARDNMNCLQDELDDIQKNKHSQELNDQKISFEMQSIKARLLQTYKIDFDKVLYKVQHPEEALKEETIDSSMALAPLELMDSSDVFYKPNVFKQDDRQSRLAQYDSMIPRKKTKEEPEDYSFLLETEELDWSQVSVDVEKMKKRCDSYGSVNLVAIEEYEALKERFEFLTKQQSDLLEAKSQLMATINKINRSTRQMFLDTFTKVGEEFRIYFRMLFGGGEAQLVLLDPENVLESGIDIVARPPGKKLQSISLMSGGEKTLTAIALVFGVFKVNPSPFCVLDEIDAALDESNVGRFGFLLKDFAKIAQFIVITHNKKTIANSDVMYGITMPETGVSRIVSVKFKEREVVQEEAVAAGV
ncbi:MAG: AAA family ATPase [Candidatus Omnitrophica bacterium]|nr:AAA family ATPase [Candidatus Omnitrophota bacterium]